MVETLVDHFPGWQGRFFVNVDVERVGFGCRAGKLDEVDVDWRPQPAILSLMAFGIVDTLYYACSLSVKWGTNDPI